MIVVSNFSCKDIPISLKNENEDITEQVQFEQNRFISDVDTIEDFKRYVCPVDISAYFSKYYDEDIYKAVLNCDIKVVKDELIEALRYDRDQYQKGYDDGYNAGVREGVKQLKEEIESLDNSLINY